MNSSRELSSGYNTERALTCNDVARFFAGDIISSSKGNPSSIEASLKGFEQPKTPEEMVNIIAFTRKDPRVRDRAIDGLSGEKLVQGVIIGLRKYLSLPLAEQISRYNALVQERSKPVK